MRALAHVSPQATSALNRLSSLEGDVTISPAEADFEIRRRMILDADQPPPRLPPAT